VLTGYPLHVVLQQTNLPRTAEAIAANELRAAIVRGDLAPGAKIPQELTAQQLGISLIPVREALKTLATEGLITYQPQRGYFVTELPDQSIEQIYEVRSLLESETERLAVPHLGPAHTEAMRAHLRTQERAAEDHDAVGMIAANRSLHFNIFDRCENRWLVRFVTQLWDSIDPYRVLLYRRIWLDRSQWSVANGILAEHDRIITALENGRTERALRLLEQHRRGSEASLKVLVAGLPPRGPLPSQGAGGASAR
jgi:DNA-binding GntR family transcriptional regulator